MSPENFEARNADPTKYSALPVPEMVQTGTMPFYDEEIGENVERAIYTDDLGNRYFQITFHPSTQQFVSRMMKGLINVADVLELPPQTPGGPPVFVSKEFDLDKDIAHASLDEIQADEYIFAHLFIDIDHRIFLKHLEEHTKTDLLNPKKGGNTRYQDEKGYHFDFAPAYSRFFMGIGSVGSRLLAVALREDYSLQTLESIREKTDRIIAQYQGSSGKALMRRIVKSTGKILPQLFEMPNTLTAVGVSENDQLDQFFKIFMERARRIRQIATDEIARREYLRG